MHFCTKPWDFWVLSIPRFQHLLMLDFLSASNQKKYRNTTLTDGPRRGFISPLKVRHPVETSCLSSSLVNRKIVISQNFLRHLVSRKSLFGITFLSTDFRDESHPVSHCFLLDVSG